MESCFYIDVGSTNIKWQDKDGKSGSEKFPDPLNQTVPFFEVSTFQLLANLSSAATGSGKKVYSEACIVELSDGTLWVTSRLESGYNGGIEHAQVIHAVEICPAVQKRRLVERLEALPDRFVRIGKIQHKSRRLPLGHAVEAIEYVENGLLVSRDGGKTFERRVAFYTMLDESFRNSPSCRFPRKDPVSDSNRRIRIIIGIKNKSARNRRLGIHCRAFCYIG